MLTPSRIDPTPSLWDDELLSEGETDDAIRQMHALLIQRFPSLDLNCSSPVALGRHLMAACWHKDGIKVPPSPLEILRLLKSTSPQGRHEILTLPHLETIPALYEYDMRLAYLWCCKSLPYGWVEMTRDGSRSGYHKQQAWWSAPQEWQHIGLLPTRGLGWVYPVQGQGWIDQREWDLARRSGWVVGSVGGLTWGREGALDRWSDGLQWTLRQVAEGSLIYRMLRRVALHSIGSLHRTTCYDTHTRAIAPVGNPSARYDQGSGLYTWREERPIQGRAGIYVHPEWTTTIWARCRARMAQAALQVPREHLIAIRQDAIYTSVRMPQWDGGRARVGDIRLKWWLDSPLDETGKYLLAPHTMEALEALRRGE